MDKKSLNLIRKIYEKGGNIIQYLKEKENLERNTEEVIKISYDFQSGSYIKETEENPEFNEKYTETLSKVIELLDIKYNSIVEVGIGEATTLANLIPKLKSSPEDIYGFDLSWSRVRYGIDYIKNEEVTNPPPLIYGESF